MKKKEILPLVTPWMDLEGIMLSETNTVRSPLNVESQKKKERKKEIQKKGAHTDGGCQSWWVGG